jgi:hypothetical protein
MFSSTSVPVTGISFGRLQLYLIWKSFNICTRWISWLRHCATSRKVAGLIPDGVGIFHWHNPSCCTMVWGRLSL